MDRLFAKSKYQIVLMLGLFLVVFGGCSEKSGESENQAAASLSSIEKESFGTLEDGREVDLYTLTNKNGVEIEITNYGGIVTSIRVPDINGEFDNVVLGFDSLKKYIGDNDPFLGALIGRYGNRIADASFTLDGTEYQLAANDGDNHLHGGETGYNDVLWDAEIAGDSLKLSYLSEDGEEGYPGNLDITVYYSLTEQNELKIEYEATTDKATPVNLTNHSYFNLTGDPATPILDHELLLNADQYTPVDDELIPTGEIVSVEGTPFDFTEPQKIGARIGQVEGGYDHNFVLNSSSDSLQHAGTLYDPSSGREMNIYTTEPGIQFYSGNFLDGSLEGPDGTPFVQHGALCLETQHFPNSPNEDSFPSTILRPGKKYLTTTIYQFGVREE